MNKQLIPEVQPAACKKTMNIKMDSEKELGS